MQFTSIITLLFFPFYLHGKIDEELVSDVIFPKTAERYVGKLYQMLKVWDAILTRHNIPYWIDGGTLLGAIRHHGQIPWDDDADVEIFIFDWPKVLSLEEEFKQYGFKFYMSGQPQLRTQDPSYPCWIDIFFSVKDENTGKIGLFPPWNSFWPDNWFYEEELFPIQYVPFGPILLQAPNDPKRYLQQLYGEDCLEFAVLSNHSRMKFSHKVKIVDFNPASYVIEDDKIPLDPPSYP